VSTAFFHPGFDPMLILHDSSGPFSDGPLKLPYQRPVPECRTFKSELVEKTIRDLNASMVDRDLFRIFENAFPNTLDTTVRWHVDGTQDKAYSQRRGDADAWQGAQSFIVTGDINAEWLRDSTNQLAQYQRLAAKDKKIYNLILGAINTQAEYIIAAPYCNAFQPPAPSSLSPTNNGQADAVHPAYDPETVFECKYELDSLAAFLSLSNQFHNSTKSTAFLTPRWHLALESLLQVLNTQSQPTFSPTTGSFHPQTYTFQRQTTLATETLPLAGNGNPLNSDTHLIRSAFRPSDDATTLGFLIPANAYLAVQLRLTGTLLSTTPTHHQLGAELLRRGEELSIAVRKHGTITHPTYGKVFAYEVDGYGSAIIMDDANLPSLLSLPLLGFCDASDPVYVATRKMILSKAGNPYYLTGSQFKGIGGPHIGLRNAWPISVMVEIMTLPLVKGEGGEEAGRILELLEMIKSASKLGLIHESVDVENVGVYTRSWFAWANSVFAQMVLDLAERRPEVVFGKGGRRFVVGGE
jgi:meiotically up-regulated gene 157 (Mug157) protein